MRVKVSILESLELTPEQYEGFNAQAGVQKDLTLALILVETSALQLTPINIIIQPFSEETPEAVKPVKKGAKK